MSSYGDYQRRYYQEHREKVAAYYKALRKERKDNHQCVRCRRQDAYTLNGRSLCAACCRTERERQFQRAMNAGRNGK